jgi:predicted metal-dependent phosphoesterase TrpH
LTGVEISASYGNREVHVLGLGVDIGNVVLVESLTQFCQERATRADAIIEKLDKIGVTISREDIAEFAGDASLGRIHIAKALHARGHASSVQDAFDKFIGGGKRAYVAKPMISVHRAIELIHLADGLAFLAHPGIGTMPRIATALLEFDFDGIEAYHVHHHPDQVQEFLTIANTRNLLVTGGSDCHGTIKGHEPEMGKVRVPWWCYEKIITALK